MIVFWKKPLSEGVHMKDISQDHREFLRKTYLFPTKIPLHAKPMQLSKGKGLRVWDLKGEEYLDALGGVVSISVGHNHPKIKERILDMANNDEVQHTTSLFLSLYMEELAEKLAHIAPGSLKRSYITNSGSEANEMAIMTARVHTGEQMFVALRHGYHGGTGVPMGFCGHSNWRFKNQPVSSVTHAPAPYCYRCPFGAQPQSCNLECAHDIKNIIETSTNGGIAGFIMEPILGVGGFIDPPLEYHKVAYDHVKEFGGLFIADEVQTGVGRTGDNFFAIEDSRVIPDMITMAKGLGNGAPIGAVITTDKISDSLKGKMHFNTFGGDPYQSMQAGTVIDIIKEENLIENAKQIGKFIKEGLQDLQKDFPLIGDVRGRGLMLGLELVQDRKTKTPAPTQTRQLIDACKDARLLVGKGGLYGNVIRIAPPLNIDRSEAKELLEKLQIALLSLSKQSSV